MHAYIHGQTSKDSGLGKIGSVLRLGSTDKKLNEELMKMATSLTMHIAAMKPSYLKEQDIPDKVRQDILDGENGAKALKKYIKKEILWEQELATA